MNQEIHSSKTSNGATNMSDVWAMQTSLYCPVKTALQQTHTNNHDSKHATKPERKGKRVSKEDLSINPVIFQLP